MVGTSPVHRVSSKDGTEIAYERSGVGPAVIVVGGAFSYRRFPKSVELAELLSRSSPASGARFHSMK
jgi:hypothetical protein